MTLLAITGATGFVGTHLLPLAAAQGFTVRALTRRAQPSHDIDWVRGDLENPAALAELVAGADAVIHLAGVINPADPADFERGNIAGTAALLAAAAATGVPRVIHVSSLAAREPRLSRYGASKAGAEALFGPDLPFDWTIVRPPGVYGPGDRETLALFQMVARGVALLPATGRLSLIEAGDLSAALLALARGGASGETVEIDDGTPNGVSHSEFAELIGDALGRKPLVMTVPPPLLTGAAAVASAWGRLTGSPPRLSRDRARYLAHPDWVVRGPGLGALWTPQVPLDAGLRATATWYRAQGWL